MSQSARQRASAYLHGHGGLERASFTSPRGARSRDGWWRLSKADVDLVVDEEAAERWTVEVRLTGEALIGMTARTAVDIAHDVAALLLVQVEDKRVRRVDLCADVVGFPLHAIEPEAWVTQRRSTVEEIGAWHDYHGAQRRTGFAVGRTDMRMRVYDKTEELRRASPEKREAEHEWWSRGGWNGDERVTRVEFQLRGAVLDELSIRSPEALLRRLDPVWSYCTRKWIRLVVLGSATRRKNCQTDPAWHVVQVASFGSSDTTPAERIRCRGGASVRAALGPVTSWALGAGVAPGFAERAKELSRQSKHEPARAEAMVRRHMADVGARWADAVCVNILHERGPEGALLYLAERELATRARLDSFSDRYSARRVREEHAL